ncbi:MAG TPA: recombinase RecT [Terracidiphilus sp.]|nr:recombinase RecT [Terracidiphilus sp.]
MSDPKQAVQMTGRKDIKEWLSSPAMLAEIAKVLPKHITGERMLRVMLTCFLRTPKLAECSRESLTQALMTCSQAGLEPDGRLAHLIPYGTVCQVIFDWKGLVALGLRNGFDSIFADVVCEGDDFEASMVNGVKMIRHVVNWRKPRGDVECVYAVAVMKGVLDYEILTLAESDDLRKRSRAANNGPWVTDTREMRKKGPIRRMSKRWDLLPEIRDVINAEDDTPDIPQPVRMARPIFSLPAPAPEPEAENGNGGAKAPSPETPPPTDATPAAQTPPGGEKPGVSEPTPAKGPLSDVRKLCKIANVGEGEILEYLAAIGTTDGSAGALDEVKGDVLAAVVKDWKAITEKIKATRAGGDTRGGLL